VTYRLDRVDREWLEFRVRELMAEGYGRIKATYLAVDELQAERRRTEDELIRAKGADPGEIDRRIADR
jgi:hypothetical protein